MDKLSLIFNCFIFGSATTLRNWPSTEMCYRAVNVCSSRVMMLFDDLTRFMGRYNHLPYHHNTQVAILVKALHCITRFSLKCIALYLYIKYTHGWVLLFLMRSWIPVIHLPIFIRIISLALGQPYDCPRASEATLKDVSKIHFDKQKTTKRIPFDRLLECTVQT